jgi:hypothetical protein
MTDGKGMDGDTTCAEFVETRSHSGAKDSDTHPKSLAW